MSFILQSITTWFLIFMFYSFAGWLIEVFVTAAENHKVVNRGFLVGPICPIYGVGSVLLSLIIDASEGWFVVFCVAIVGGAILEYTVSYLMEKIFRVRWWDYSDRVLNLNGRICLRSLLCFGVGGIIIVKLVTPFLLYFINVSPLWIINIIAAALLIWLIFDIILSLWLIMDVRVTVGTVQKDATEEISERVREILMDKGKLNRRLVKAFPHQTPSQKPRTRISQKSRKPQPTKNPQQPQNPHEK